MFCFVLFDDDESMRSRLGGASRKETRASGRRGGGIDAGISAEFQACRMSERSTVVVNIQIKTLEVEEIWTINSSL